MNQGIICFCSGNRIYTLILAIDAHKAKSHLLGLGLNVSRPTITTGKSPQIT